tara:strand:- start:3 stop:245 length:243 start_codon:yes stop_codon:yes gene_type:complete
MAKTKHFYHGCPWASGEVQSADTDQRYDWKEVTCSRCLSNKMSTGESRYWYVAHGYRSRERFEQLAKSFNETVEWLKSQA